MMAYRVRKLVHVMFVPIKYQCHIYSYASFSA